MPLLRSGRIRDPVHGYVFFTGIERPVIDHPVTQRLRYVSQNGLAHLVYPEVRTARFSHSLGAMHLASQFFAAAISNTSSTQRNTLLNEIAEEVKVAAGAIGDTERAGRMLRDSPLLAARSVAQSRQSTTLLAEQALRFAALFHDLGHLPFSHDFEDAIESYVRTLPDRSRWSPLIQEGPGREKIHEKIGHGLATLLLREVFYSISAPLPPMEMEAVRISFEFAKKILDSVPDPRDHIRRPNNALRWLHTLIDGELDVDRCDYILRDARAFGFEFAAYDLGRLVDNLNVVRDNSQGYTTAVKGPGLSSLESFLLGRYRFYQFGIRHHKVSQAGTALQHCIAEILRQPHDPTLGQFIDDIQELAQADRVPEKQRSALLQRFAGYDDPWWFHVMRDAEKRRSNEWLALVCWRRAGPKSLWKRANNFPKGIDIKDFNRNLPAWEDVAAQNRWYQETERLRSEGVLVTRLGFPFGSLG